MAHCASSLLGTPFPGLTAAIASKLLAGLNEAQSSRVIPWALEDLRISQFHGALATTLSSSTPLGSDKLTKYSRLPFEEGLNNNQLATATRASKGTRRERCPEDVMAIAPLGCGSINEGIHYTVNTFRIINSGIMKLSR